MLLLDPESFIADEQRAAAGMWDERAPEINQPGYSKNVLTLKQNSKKMHCFGEEGLLVFPQETRGCGFLQD